MEDKGMCLCKPQPHEPTNNFRNRNSRFSDSHLRPNGITNPRKRRHSSGSNSNTSQPLNKENINAMNMSNRPLKLSDFEEMPVSSSK